MKATAVSVCKPETATVLTPYPVAYKLGDPCPDLLTEEQAIRYLRLDQINIKHPRQTLRRYRKAGLIKGTQVGKRIAA